MRTGLLGASAAVAVGAVVVTSGLLPGGDTFTIGSAGSSEQRTQQSRQAPELTTQGGATETPALASGGTGKGTTGGGASPSATPSAKPSPKATPKHTPTPSKTTKAAVKPTAPKAPAAPTTKAPAPKAPAPKAPAPKAPTTKAPAPKPAPTTAAPTGKAAVTSTADRGQAAEAEVLRLVNTERAKVGCTPVHSDARLASLAGAFSADMATRGFFDHTDPDGDTPWARAQQAGISGMGGENIARGQVDAAAVMTSWMNSDGHRANILNCDFTTLGVGVHFADGGPWWTQDFGY